MKKIIDSIIRELEFEHSCEDFCSLISGPAERYHFYSALMHLQQLSFLMSSEKPKNE